MARKDTPWHDAILEAQIPLLRTLPNVAELMAEADVDSLIRSCWACGTLFPEGRYPTRAHLHAHRDGGDDADPKNFVLLCDACHSAQPDAAPVEDQIAWLRARPSAFALLLTTYVPALETLLRSLATDHGEAAVERWIRETPAAELAGVLRNAPIAASWQMDNSRANRVWALRAAFRKWLEGRPTS